MSAPDGASTPVSVWRGLRCRCPACGEGRLFGRFLKVAPACDACGTEFHHHRADDFPPYLVMFLVGHLVGYGIFYAETRYEDVPLLLHALLWPTLTVVLCVGLLQPVKGAVVGLQYGLGMHGFPGPARRPAAAAAGSPGGEGAGGGRGGARGEGRPGRGADLGGEGRGARPVLAEPEA